MLQPNTLRLFQQLTGKKFPSGYEIAIQQEFRAFEWGQEPLQCVRKRLEALLCDAIFGTVGFIEGYGQKKYTDEKHILTGIWWKKEIGKMAHVEGGIFTL